MTADTINIEMHDLLVKAYREIKFNRLNRNRFWVNLRKERPEADRLEWQIAQLLSQIVDAEAQA